MELNSIKDVDVRDKRVFLRVDFNVSLKNNEIDDDYRIKAALSTVNYLVENGAKVIIATHLGRPEGRESQFSTQKLAFRLEELCGHRVKFSPECYGSYVDAAVAKLQSGDILMLENLRFYPEEEKNDDEFAKKLASSADIYVNNAFAVCHRAHASVSAITKYLPAYAGFLLEREVHVLQNIYSDPEKPLVIAIGGAKAETKIGVIKRFFDVADHILVGGVIANVILEKKGVSVGRSEFDKGVSSGLEGVDLASSKMHIPVDLVVANEVSEEAKTEVVGAGSVKDDQIILDIGPSTANLFSEIIKKANTVVWNGPFGFSEIELFSRGTNQFVNALYESRAYKVVGGGDSITALDRMKMLDSIDFVSTGGGAMLELLAGNDMPGIDPLIKK